MVSIRSIVAEAQERGFWTLVRETGDPYCLMVAGAIVGIGLMFWVPPLWGWLKGRFRRR